MAHTYMYYKYSNYPKYFGTKPNISLSVINVKELDYHFM